MKNIRDFIYLDKDRVNSLYSQVNEGVAEAIVNSYVSNKETRERVDKVILGQSTEDKVGEYSNVTENKILHDHIYNKLKEILKNNIYIPKSINEKNYKEKLQDKFLIKIKGKVKIHNYNRMKMYLEEFNNIGEIVAYSICSNNTNSNNDAENKSGKQKYEENKQIKELTKLIGLKQDSKMLDGLKKMIELFNDDGFELIVQGDNQQIIYRVVLDTKYLRLNTDMLRILYTQNPMNEWTIVGQITYIPNIEASKNSNPVQDVDKQPGIREAYKNMIDVTASLEDAFFISNKNIEITITPMAIYREQEINI